MGRKVNFKIEGSLLQSEIVKVDRTKLYGTSQKVVYDTNKEECVLSDLYEGSIILPKGSIGQVLIDEEGKSVSRSELIGFNIQGEKVEKVPSIFSIENSCKRVDIDKFLSSSIKSIYQLIIDEEQIEMWKKFFLNDEIYLFEFNYREDYEGDDAFLISNEQGFFIGIGKSNELEFLELSNISLEDTDDDIDLEDDLDFSMF
ncbi:hypothetical protein N8334_00215 [Flavobacteriaceae bacterium]|jgi:hypothetical protein|nr:hypothetical protein [Flavobacteriaceae bacterium]|tara:strand:- start:109 stop:711 length:603 start_codon:yes stop_codon:yes gene_type:complete